MADDPWELVSREGLIESIRNISGGREVNLLGDPEVRRIAPQLQGVTSFVFHVKVQYRVADGGEADRTASLFLKCSPKYKIQLEFIKSTKMFHVEWLFFQKVVPLMRKVSAGKVDLPLPLCYHTDCDGEKGTFYMEDLLDSGYRPADDSYVLSGLDYAHCSLVMRRLGIFHALTMTGERSSPKSWTEMHPELSQDFVFYAPKPGDTPSPIQGIIDTFIGNTKEISKGIDGLPREAEASGDLDRVIGGFWSAFCGLRETPSHGWSVLSHGDLWENNIMFRYERGDDGVERPVDVKFFDMQMVKCCHPAVDISYFLYQSTGRSFREQHLGDLIGEYYAAVCHTLEVLGGDAPPSSLEHFKADAMGRFRPLGVIARAIFAPLNMLRDDPVPSSVGENRTEEGLEDFFKTGNTSLVRIRSARDPAYREKVEEVIREFVDMALPNGLGSTDSSPLLRWCS